MADERRQQRVSCGCRSVSECLIADCLRCAALREQWQSGRGFKVAAEAAVRRHRLRSFVLAMIVTVVEVTVTATKYR